MMGVTVELFSCTVQPSSPTLSLKSQRRKVQMEAAHGLYIFLQQSQHIVQEYRWVVRLELGRHRWASFHLPRSTALHLCRASSSSSEVWIQVKMQLEKLNFPWLILKINSEQQSTKTGKQYKQVPNCIFQQLELTRIACFFQWKLAAFWSWWWWCPNLAENFRVWMIHSLFAAFQNCHYGSNTFQTETKHTFKRIAKDELEKV